MSKQPAIHILASRKRGTLYIGVAGSLKARILEHKTGAVDGFARKFCIKRLVWYELLPDFPSAIRREKQLKKWNRAWKLELAENFDPT